jgi:pimeloyl-ACP methyl ester carboxylesterase
MSRAAANGIEIEYDTFGTPADPAVLLVMGLGGQMTAWEEGFCELLASHGRYVIRFDNRDVGLSTKLDDTDVDVAAVVMAALAGEPLPPVPYTLSAMSDDAFGLLDALGIERAHIVGASMGGMIVQTMAIEHPDRVLTMTSIMSNTGEQEYGGPTDDAMQMLMAPPPADRTEYIESSIRAWKIIGSPRYTDEAKVRARAAASYDRSFYPPGTNRQVGAVAASGSRAEGLRQLRVPTLVIHGRADPLIQLTGGERTAELVPAANLLVCNDMGHDLPEPLWPLIADVIVSHTAHAIG